MNLIWVDTTLDWSVPPPPGDGGGTSNVIFNGTCFEITQPFLISSSIIFGSNFAPVYGVRFNLTLTGSAGTDNVGISVNTNAGSVSTTDTLQNGITKFFEWDENSGFFDGVSSLEPATIVITPSSLGSYDTVILCDIEILTEEGAVTPTPSATTTPTPTPTPSTSSAGGSTLFSVSAGSLGNPNILKKIDVSNMSETGEFAGDIVNALEDLPNDVTYGNGFVYIAGKDITKVDAFNMTLEGTFTDHTDRVRSIDFGNDGFLYSGSDDGTVKKIDPVTMTEVGQFAGHTGGVGSVIYGDDGFVYSASAEIKKIDPSDMSDAGTGTGTAFSMTFGNYQGNDFIYLGQSNQVARIDPSDMSSAGSAFGFTDTIATISFGGDGNVYGGGTASEIKKISPQTLNVFDQFTGHTGQVRGIVYGNDGFLYSGSDDGTVRKVNPSTMTQIDIFNGHTSNVRAVTFAPIPPT